MAITAAAMGAMTQRQLLVVPRRAERLVTDL
jgi:hypothetical protein